MVAMQLQKYAADGHVACAAAPSETIQAAAPKDLNAAWKHGKVIIVTSFSLPALQLEVAGGKWSAVASTASEDIIAAVAAWVAHVITLLLGDSSAKHTGVVSPGGGGAGTGGDGGDGQSHSSLEDESEESEEEEEEEALEAELSAAIVQVDIISCGCGQRATHNGENSKRRTATLAWCGGCDRTDG
jgi:hypothetical protein